MKQLLKINKLSKIHHEALTINKLINKQYMKEYTVKFYGSLYTQKYLGNSNHFKTKKEIFDKARLELAKIAKIIFKANQVKKEFFDKYQSLKKASEKTSYQDAEKFDLFCNQDIYDKNIFIDAEDIGEDHCHSFTIGDDTIDNGTDRVFFKVFSKKYYFKVFSKKIKD